MKVCELVVHSLSTYKLSYFIEIDSFLTGKFYGKIQGSQSVIIERYTVISFYDDIKLHCSRFILIGIFISFLIFFTIQFEIDVLKIST